MIQASLIAVVRCIAVLCIWSELIGPSGVRRAEKGAHGPVTGSAAWRP